MPHTFRVTEKTARTITCKKSFEFRNVELPENPDTINAKDFKALYNHKPKKCQGEILQSTPNLKDTVVLGGNSFVYALYRSYSSEHNLILRPEDVWLAIVTQFSFYVNANSEQLRSKFVDFDGKKELIVYGSGTIRTVDHGKFMKSFATQISENIKDPSIREWVVPSFTTTTDNDKIVASSLLMATMKKYFDFKCVLECGLCDVTLLGEVADWVSVRQRAQRLLEFDNKGRLINKWCTKLLPLLSEFVLAAQGKPNIDWWNRICTHIGGGSGPSYINGWLTVFCVFNEEGKWQVQDECRSHGRKYETDFFILESNDIPVGYTHVPIKYDDNGTPYKTTLVVGHLSAHVINSDTYQPALGWFLMIDE
jgi:hypothetical protein